MSLPRQRQIELTRSSLRDEGLDNRTPWVKTHG